MADSRPLVPFCYAQIYGLADQKEWSIDFWFSPDPGTAPGGWIAETAAAAIFGGCTTGLAALLSTTWKILGGRIYFNFGDGTLGVEYYHSIVGTNSSAPLPEFTTVIVRKICASFDRSAQGWWKVPGVCENHTQGSYLSTAGVTAWTGIATQWLSPITDQGITYTPSQFSRKLVTLYPIVNTPLTQKLGTNRRRRFTF